MTTNNNKPINIFYEVAGLMGKEQKSETNIQTSQMAKIDASNADYAQKSDLYAKKSHESTSSSSGGGWQGWLTAGLIIAGTIALTIATDGAAAGEAADIDATAIAETLPEEVENAGMAEEEEGIELDDLSQRQPKADSAGAGGGGEFDYTPDTEEVNTPTSTTEADAAANNAPRPDAQDAHAEVDQPGVDRAGNQAAARNSEKTFVENAKEFIGPKMKIAAPMIVMGTMTSLTSIPWMKDHAAGLNDGADPAKMMQVQEDLQGINLAMTQDQSNTQQEFQSFNNTESTIQVANSIFSEEMKDYAGLTKVYI